MRAAFPPVGLASSPLRLTCVASSARPTASCSTLGLSRKNVLREGVQSPIRVPAPPGWGERLTMLRLLIYTTAIGLWGTAAQAGCIDEVMSAFETMHRRGPFHFQVTGGSSNEKLEVSGIVDWPSAFRFQTEGPQGHVEQIFIGPRKWFYDRGSWHGGRNGSTHDGTPEMAIMFHEFLFGFGPYLGAEAIKARAQEAIKDGVQEYDWK